MSISKEYFELTKKYKEQYGEKTVVLMLVGVFYEIYAIKTPNGSQLSNIDEVSQICNYLSIVEDKKTLYDNYPLLMSGFRDYTLEKYLQKLSDAGYTSVIYNQNKSGSKITRELAEVYSPGTFVAYDESDATPKTTNHIMAIWIERIRKPTGDILIIGTAAINIFTGNSVIYEYQTPYMITPITFDDLERQISTIMPNEIIVISNIDKSPTEKIVQYSGVLQTNALLHYIYMTASDYGHTTSRENTVKIANCSKQNYIRQMIAQLFTDETYDICMEFRENELATQAFCFLLNFVQEHNPDLVRRISIPLFDTSNTRVMLACHTLKQLYIIDDRSADYLHTPNSLTSVTNLLNKSCTQMGKRKLYDQITKPTFDEQWLNREYQMTQRLIDSDTTVIDIPQIRKMIHNIRDIDKILRQIVLKKIYPVAIYNLYESVKTIGEISEMVLQVDSLGDYLRPKPIGAGSPSPISQIVEKFRDFIDSRMWIQKCKSIASTTIFDENIFKRGVSDKLDQLYDINCCAIMTFNKFRESLNRVMLVLLNGKTNNVTEFVKEHTTEKSGTSLQITKKRGDILKSAISQFYDCNHVYHDLTVHMEFVSVNSTTYEISSPKIICLTKQMLHGKEQMNEVLEQTYKHFLTTLENEWYSQLNMLSKYIADLDVIVTKAFIAKEYNYCQPQISDSNEKSFVNVQRLRHPLIEHIQKNETYVANDLEIGKDGVDGILLYGTNAVGKTSFIRSVGIAIIMAQAGMYVAASKFVYRPYRSIFSRILSNDDLFRGLSTFAVEMSELRIILKFADQYSLILGDELCSGTEIESALSIFMAGLMEFHRKRASFLFATHFHQIIDYSEMVECPRIRLKHMSVIYDRQLDALVYDRILKDGPGTRMYGLEVCKSLHLEDSFLEMAYGIRNKYDQTGENGLLQRNTSVYNTAKIKGRCEKCQETLSEEVHHLSPQRDADKRGFIDTFHKNHPANLMALCSKCHDSMHHENVNVNSPKKVVKKIVKKKTTKGYIFQESAATATATPQESIYMDTSKKTK